MKRFLCILFAVMMILAVAVFAASCGGEDKPDDTTSQTEKQPDTTASQSETEKQPDATEPEQSSDTGDKETQPSSDAEPQSDPQSATQSDTEPQVTDTSDTEPQVTDTSDTEPSLTIVIPTEYADVDFGGKTFNVIYRYQTAEDTPSGWGQVFDLYLNEDNPDDALSASAKFLMVYMGSTFNCTVNGVPSIDPGTAMSNAIQSGDSIYDMILSRTSPSGYANGKFYNLLPMLDQSLTCWDNAVIRDLAIGNKLYGITGNCSTSDDDATWVMFFNKTLLSENNLEYPYQLVRDGKWTIDKFLEYSRNCQKELDGDDVISNLNGKDIFGFVTHGEHAPAVWIGCGIRLAGPVQADGTIKTSCNALGYEADIFAKVLEVMYDSSTGYANKQTNMGVPGGLRAVFTSGRAAFYGECLGNIGNSYQSGCLKDVEGLSFGVIPQPKWNEEQTEYYHYVNNQASFIGIPITANYGIATRFLNVYGLVFEQTVQATYISNVATAWVSDPDVADMMRLIFDSRVWDAGYWYNSSAVHANLLSDVGTNNNRYSKRVEKGEGKLQSSLDELFNKIGTLTV